MGVVIAIPLLLFGAFLLVRVAHAQGLPHFPWSKTVKHPVVFFPGYSTSRLKVTVVNQTFNPECPPDGNFEFCSGHILPWEFSEKCVLEALKVLYDPSKPALQDRFSSQPGVTVEVADWGSLGCAPIYLPIYLRLVAAGYAPDASLFVACYDFRMAPNVDVTPGHAFVAKSRELVERAYRRNKRRRVYLLAHSNGGPMAQFLLNAMSPAWRRKYVAGLVAYAGNWAGQGSFYSYLFTGVSFSDFSTPVPEAAFTLHTWPGVYFSMSQPAVFGDREVVVQVGQKNYTPAGYQDLFEDAKLDLAKELFPLFNGLASPSRPPQVSVHSFYGSGLKTEVGMAFPELRQAVLPLGRLYMEGDGDQEALDNEANLGWNASECHAFEAIECPKTSHLLLPFSLAVLSRTLEILRSEDPGQPCAPRKGMAQV